MQPIPQELITKALALTGLTMEDMNGYIDDVLNEFCVIKSLSIEKFCYYLLSEDFLKQYHKKIYPNEVIYDYKNFLYGYVEDFGISIFQFQKGNSQPLIDLLNKI